MIEPMTRRNLLTLCAAGAAAPLWPRDRPKTRNARKRRVLFNWDGSMVQCYGRAALGNPSGPLTSDQFISLVFTPIENTAVDAVLFSFGSGNVAEYQSNVL